MPRNARLGSQALALLTLAGFGCAEEAGTGINPTPTAVINPAAPDETTAKPEATPEANPTQEVAKPDEPGAAPLATSVTPVELGTGKPEEAAPPVEGVRLDHVKYDAFLARVAAEGKSSKLTLVDAWATWCGPCKENFPHVLEMNEKYGPQGLKVISLSMDDPTEPDMVAAANKFLVEQKSTITNLLMDETPEVAFEKLNVNGIPAVFLFGPDGKEVARYTMDDPNKQFTYAQVEADVAKILKGDAPAK